MAAQALMFHERNPLAAAVRKPLDTWKNAFLPKPFTAVEVLIRFNRWVIDSSGQAGKKHSSTRLRTLAGNNELASVGGVFPM